MTTQIFGVETQKTSACFKIRDFPLVYKTMSKAIDRGSPASLEANCVKSEPIMKVGEHQFHIYVAWSLDRDAELMPHSMLGIAIGRDKGDKKSFCRYDLRLVNNSAFLSSSLKATSAIGNPQGLYPSPNATRREESDGFVLLSEVLDERAGWLSSGTLTIECEIEIVLSKGRVVESASEQSLSNANMFGNLSFQLGQLLETGLNSDVTISVEEETLHAHSLILSVRSPVFQAMWLHNMRESKRHNVIIEDFTASTVRMMLDFMYTGKLSKQLEACDETVSLLQAAHKYELLDLLQLCVQALARKLDADRAIEYLMLADLIGADDLRQKCLAFIAKSPQSVAQAQSSESFSRLTKKRPHLVADILAAAFPPAKLSRTTR